MQKCYQNRHHDTHAAMGIIQKEINIKLTGNKIAKMIS